MDVAKIINLINVNVKIVNAALKKLNPKTNLKLVKNKIAVKMAANVEKTVNVKIALAVVKN